MEIEKTSKFIKCMYEEDEDVDFDDLDYRFEVKMLFTTFANNKNLSIDFDKISDFLDKFNKLHKIGIFTNFSPPLVQEYFCQQLNFLLIIDFILTFFKVDDNDFNIKKINTKFIFDFFVMLGEFYNFMNYLDVDEHFVNYLKYMLILYAFQLDRNVIEEKYHYYIFMLDDFFKNDIMLQLFSEIRYKTFNREYELIKKYQKSFPEEIKEYDANLSLNGGDYAFLNKLFVMNNYSTIDVSVKTKQISVVNPNPRPPPPQLNNATTTNAMNNNDSDSDSDYAGDLIYDSDDSDQYNPWTPYNSWTPYIYKEVPVIEVDDINYKEYRKLFIQKNYQMTKFVYDQIINEIKTMCEPLQLKKYDSFEPNNNSIQILKVKTIFGCVLDYKNISVEHNKTLFGLACDYGHLEIIKKILDNLNGDIGLDNFEHAQTSPNRDIPRYLINYKSSYKKLDEVFTYFKNNEYFEPKIKFNS
jgi:hypothetical protein